VPGAVQTGIDVLRAEGFAPLRGRRVGLITHRSALSSRGHSTLDELRGAPGVSIVAVFTPEHGYGAQMDEAVPSLIDVETGLPFYSLFGVSRRPSQEQLNGIDLLVCDLQDVGARFYTYITTMAYTMEEAARFGISYLVLDRPNVLNGIAIEGPLLRSEHRSFVGYFPFPIRHGLTIGEVAHWYVSKEKLDLDLNVIPVRGWQRGMWFDDTGLPWVPPSPAMRSLTTAILYPGICCLERTNVSVGRGTDHPFEWVGAPWVEAEALAATLEERAIAGVRFQPLDFSPASSIYAGEVCHGVAIEITDRNQLNSVQLGFHLLDAIHRQNPVEFDFGNSLPLLGDTASFEALRSFVPVEEIFALWERDLKAFAEEREDILLYRDSGELVAG